MSFGLAKMTDRTEKDPRFRNTMYALIAGLALAYFGMKAWHIKLALAAYEGQVLEQDTHGAAK
jgi:hypothetical protein